VAGGVHQVELIGLAVLVLIVEAHGLRLDGDAALALDLHGIEDLVLHLAVGDVAAQLDQPVGQRRLAVVDVRDDGEIADQRRVGHGRLDNTRTLAAKGLAPRMLVDACARARRFATRTPQ
jgi:hypothetical protein